MHSKELDLYFHFPSVRKHTAFQYRFIFIKGKGNWISSTPFCLRKFATMFNIPTGWVWVSKTLSQNSVVNWCSRGYATKHKVRMHLCQTVYCTKWYKDTGYEYAICVVCAYLLLLLCDDTLRMIKSFFCPVWCELNTEVVCFQTCKIVLTVE